jgi:hypothetical protein
METSWDIAMDNKVLTIFVLVTFILEILHLMFSIYSYFYLRNKQFTPCSVGEYRNVN